MTFTMATSASETDMRSVAMREVFAPMVAGFADYKAGYNGSLFAQGTELDAISRGNVTMSIASSTGIGTVLPRIFDLCHWICASGCGPSGSRFQQPADGSFQKKAEDELGVKLLSVMYLGRRHVNLRFPRSEKNIMTPADLAGVNLRMPGTDSWQFLGKALGASPTPLSFNEVYTAPSTGAVDGQDNPLPTVVDKKFYEGATDFVNIAPCRFELYCILKEDLGWPYRRAETDRTACG